MTVKDIPMEASRAVAGCWEWDPAAPREVRITEGLAAIFGLPAGVVITREDLLACLPTADRIPFKAAFAEVLASGRPCSVEHEIRSRKGGKTMAVTRLEQLSHPDSDGPGRISAVVFAGSAASKPIIRYNDYARNIIESAPVGIVIIDEATHHILDINETGAHLVGLPKAEITGRICHQFMCPSQLGRCPITDLEQEIDNAERILISADGTRRPILKTVIRTYLDGRRCLVEIFIDIRARKEAECKLKERDDRLAEAEEWADFGTWEWDLASGQVTLSDGFCRILQASPEDFRGGIKDLLAWIHPTDRQMVTTLNSQALERGVPYNRDVRFLMPQGDERIIFVHAGAAFDQDGRATRLVGLVQDVTTARQREENFLAQNEFLTTVIESFAQPFYVIDAKSYAIVYANTTAVRTIGENWENLTCYEWTHNCKEPCTGTEHLCPLAEVNKTGLPVVTEHQHFDRDGKIRHYAVYGYPIFNPKGEIVQMIEFTRDVTQRRAMSMALRLSEERYRNLSQEFNVLLDAIPDRIMLVSAEFRVLWANRQAHAEFQGLLDGKAKPFCYTLRGEDRPCKDCPVCTSLNTGKMAEVQISSAEGRFWELRAIPIVEEDGAVHKVVEIAHDITDRITLQADAMRAGHMASLGELAAGVAHEINNPINSIINFAQILADEMEQKKIDSDIPAWIMKEGDRVAAIVQSLLSFARQRDTTDELIEVGDLIDESLALTGTQIKKDGIRLVIDVPAGLPLLRGNFQKIQQVFLNIINNARYALNRRHPGVAEEKLFRIGAQRVESEGKEWVQISFYDQGTGIPSQIIDKVTLPFFSTKPPDRGTGLGLTISRNILAEHGGKLRIQSEEDRYTDITVLLPAVPAAATAAS